VPTRIYLDANATTPVFPEVVEAMLPYFGIRFGNASSLHRAGQHARAAVERARNQLASLLGAQPGEIVFTSGGTEGANLALFGFFNELLAATSTLLQSPMSASRSMPPPRLITSSIEHHAVLHAAEALAERGVDVTFLPPDCNGIVSPQSLEEALRREATPSRNASRRSQPEEQPAHAAGVPAAHTMVSIMAANNETGVVQPTAELARIAHRYGARFHTDAVQAAGKLPIDLAPGGGFSDVDLLSISGHKLYAPQGTGALFVRKGVQLTPLFFGGPHERQRRAGTENLPGIVGLGCAAELAARWLTSDGPEQLRGLREHLERGLLAAISASAVNGGTAPGIGNTINLRLLGSKNKHPPEIQADRNNTSADGHTPTDASVDPHPANSSAVNREALLIDGEALAIALDVQGIAVSFGAACQSGATEPSHVLLAMGLTPEEARASIRISLSRLTTDEEIGHALVVIPATIARLRSLASSRFLQA
jgi:cysteine desulfurase